MDSFDIETAPGKGTTVTMRKTISANGRKLTRANIREISTMLAQRVELDPVAELTRQNRDMIMQLTELTKRQEQYEQLNRELQDTNRGVVALYAELEERADHLRRADELKSRFLSNMTHEFRTPLNSILSLARLLLSRVDGELTVEQERQVGFVRQAADNLRELVDDLLDIAKVEAGKTVVQPKEFVVDDLFSALRGMLRPLLVGDAVTLNIEPATDIPTMLTDEGKVSQILRNFISNAIKFTEKGEVRVWAQADGHGNVRFFVRDSGVGIPEEYLGKIWEEFGQAPNRLQTKVKGTGLGLPLAKRLAELLGGSVSVESAPGQGSLFSVTVPAIYPNLAEDPEEAQWTIEEGRIPILLIEDNAADAFSYERALAETRYQIIHVRTVAQARRALEKISPAAILLDLILQNEDTWHLLISLKQRELTQNVPVIVISSAQEEQKARMLGADGYLSKPIEPEGLVRALDEMSGSNSITKVLLVDDEEISRYLVRQLLPRGSFALREAASAVDGLESVKADEPDVILLDLNMGDFDGFQFLERMLNEHQTDAPPAVILSSMVLDDDQRRRLNRAAGFVSKSDLTSDNLVAAIRRAVASSGEEARA